MSNAKDFNFKLIDNFIGYNSANDKTNVDIRYLVRGSLNVFKKINGNIANRPGLKRLGDPNTTEASCTAEYVWNTSNAETFILVVNGTNLYVVIDEEWYLLQSDLDSTRYVFDTWWDDDLQYDVVLMVHGTASIDRWSGAVATVVSSTSDSLVTDEANLRFEIPSLNAIGGASSQFDITNPSGTTFRYTWDGGGTDPAITATTVPANSYVRIENTNFDTNNNGLFVVTDSETNWFEITNASGVVESNVTIGSGDIFVRFNALLQINGETYSYTSGGTTSAEFGDIIPSLSGVNPGDKVFSGIVPSGNKPEEDFMADMIKVINNQAHVASYNSRKLFISAEDDYTDFTPSVPREVGEAVQLVLDDNVSGIGLRRGLATVGIGNDRWVSIRYENYTMEGVNVVVSVPIVDVLPVSANSAPYAHEFIDNVGDTIVYLSKDQQVRTIGDFASLFEAAYPSLSQQIYTELAEENFAGGGLKAIGDFIYVTAPTSGKTYLYQSRQSLADSGQVVSERLWHPPFVWNATRVDNLDGVTIAFSNANPQIYQTWDTGQYYDDSPSEEQLSYSCVAAFPYRNNNDRTGFTIFDKLYTEGYITPGTELEATINFDYEGSTNIITVPINTETRPATLFGGSSPSSLGDSSLGDNPLGIPLEATTDSSDDLSKFRCINSVTDVSCFEYQPVYFSDQVSAQWELLALGTNEVRNPNILPSYIINKAEIV